MRAGGTLIATAVLAVSVAAPLLGQQRPIPWGGYIQARFTQTNDVTGFAIRRAKLWLAGAAPVGRGFQYKVQGLFRASNGGGFTLQDAYLEYRTGVGFLPAVINTLIPSATTGARDIGAPGKSCRTSARSAGNPTPSFPWSSVVEATLRPDSTDWQVSAGLFNGNGGNAAQNEDTHWFMN